MEKSTQRMAVTRRRRKFSVRNKVRGEAQRPRMCVVKSNKHIQVQLIDDENGVTLASISTCSKEMQKTAYCKKNKASAKVLGEKIAAKAKALGVESIIFDRGPSKYHGILAELADAARTGGLKF